MAREDGKVQQQKAARVNGPLVAEEKMLYTSVYLNCEESKNAERLYLYFEAI